MTRLWECITRLISFPGKNKISICSLKWPDRKWGQPSLLKDGQRGFFPTVRWPGCEAELSPPFIVEDKNEWFCASTFPVYVWRVNG